MEALRGLFYMGGRPTHARASDTPDSYMSLKRSCDESRDCINAVKRISDDE